MIRTTRRALVAVAASVLGAFIGIAGVGHIYLREWRRATAWFACVLGVGLILLAVYTEPAVVDPFSLPAEVTVPLLALFAASTCDAYFVARRQHAVSEPLCPNCRKSLDVDVGFCPWCTRYYE